jgi:extracellular factor (EF) 3-hydroxypalmitic acid methyl ester biosynthesis protein
LLAKTSGTEQLAIASLAIGSGREVFDVFEAQPGAPIRVTGIDIDHASLTFCAEEARKRSLGDEKLRLFQDNLVKLAFGRGRVVIPKQHFIYSMGLIDYLENELVVRLINWAHEQLAPGGTLALGNFAASSRDRPFMDYIMEWILIHRSPDEMRELFARSHFGRADVRIDSDSSGIQLFAYCTKN